MPEAICQQSSIEMFRLAYGDSDKPVGIAGYDARFLAEEFRALTRQIGFGIGKPVVIGAHDMGALDALGAFEKCQSPYGQPFGDENIAVMEEDGVVGCDKLPGRELAARLSATGPDTAV